MARYIIPDTSAIGASLYNESYSSHANPMLEAIRLRYVDAVAPSLGLAEFLNVSRRKLPVLSQSVVEAAVADFLALPIVWVDIDALALSAWRLHRDYNVETADAFFVVVAQQWQAEIWTIDQQFITAVRPFYSDIHDLKVTAFS